MADFGEDEGDSQLADRQAEAEIGGPEEAEVFENPAEGMKIGETGFVANSFGDTPNNIPETKEKSVSAETQAEALAPIV